MVKDDVLVIGGGIVGIQTATDLANLGHKVYLVDTCPSIGGRMAQLDKTFPTNDCSICILAPKMMDCYQHPNVVPMFYSEVVGAEGEIGNFKVKVKCKARYIDMEKCTGCGECTEKCPTKALDDFNMALQKRRAIYLHFLQAVPKKVLIDPEKCRFLTKGKCKVCEKTCKAGAINFDDEDEIVEIDVGAVVVCIGFDFYDMAKLPEYGYGKIKNVVTAMEFERIICASGPTGGHLERPSDQQVPHKIAFIQCAGSRDKNHKSYCTGVCCMHSTKEAILANEHHPEIESFIFYMDNRAVGKGFQDYILRAEREYKVTFVRGRPGLITEGPNGNPIVHYDDTREGRFKSMEVEMVILAQALIPSAGTRDLSNIFGFNIDEDGFITSPDRVLRPVDTTVPGVYACGFCQDPMDIPEGVAQASGAAARVAESLEVVKK